MLRFLKNLFAAEHAASEQPAVRVVPPPVLGFDDLKHTFDRRTYGFDQYRARLGQDNPRLLHWIGSVDYSGYVREASLRYLIAHYEPGDENRILLRLEDWVPIVRHLAEMWTTLRVGTLTLAEFDTNHRLILYLSRKARLRGTKGMQAIEACLRQRVSETDKAGFFALHASFRRYLYRLAIAGQPRLRAWMAEDRDPTNRLLLLGLYGFDGLTEAEREALRQDRSTLVKRAVLNAQLQHGAVPDEATLRAYVLGRNRGLRAIARFYLARHYGVEAYTLYTQRHDEVFYYIADYARVDDLPRFLQGMQRPEKHVRLLCLRAIAAVDREALRGLDLQGLFIENRRFREVLAPHLPLLLSLDALKGYKPLLHERLVNGPVIYLNLIVRKSFWHFVDEALAWLLNEPTEAAVSFVSQRFHAKPYIYETLPEALKASLIQKLERLGTREAPGLPALVKHIAFAVDNA